MSEPRIGIYPGTFDPLTNGHMDIISRATKVVDILIVCVAEHTGKDTLFTLSERLDMIQEEVRILDDAIKTSVEVQPFKTLSWLVFVQFIGFSLQWVLELMRLNRIQIQTHH